MVNDNERAHSESSCLETKTSETIGEIGTIETE